MIKVKKELQNVFLNECMLNYTKYYDYVYFFSPLQKH